MTRWSTTRFFWQFWCCRHFLELVSVGERRVNLIKNLDETLVAVSLTVLRFIKSTAKHFIRANLLLYTIDTAESWIIDSLKGDYPLSLGQCLREVAFNFFWLKIQSVFVIWVSSWWRRTWWRILKDWSWYILIQGTVLFHLCFINWILLGFYRRCKPTLFINLLSKWLIFVSTTWNISLFIWFCWLVSDHWALGFVLRN